MKATIQAIMDAKASSARHRQRFKPQRFKQQHHIDHATRAGIMQRIADVEDMKATVERRLAEHRSPGVWDRFTWALNPPQGDHTRESSINLCEIIIANNDKELAELRSALERLEREGR